MSNAEFDQWLALYLLAAGFVFLCIAALIEKRWRDTANTFGIAAISMFVMAFVQGVKS